MAAKGGDGMQGALKYQTWTLKVPIHCEGCSRKVKRVLHSIDGVFTISVNSQQHKVEVTGDVDSETLIKKLTKSGKQAELWPDQKEKKSSGKSKNKDNKQENPRDSEDAGEEASKDANGGAESEDDDGDDEGENHASENKDTGSATKEAGAAGTGGKKKKKKKKGKNKNDGGPGDGAAGGNTPGKTSGFAPPITGSTGVNPFPSVCYTPQTHGVSYNAAYPSPNASYYGASPMHAYSYSHPGPVYSLPPPSAPIKSYLNDDQDYDDGGGGGGGCSIM